VAVHEHKKKAAKSLGIMVLLVDEVLSVGDIGFQRKCIEKMKDVTGYGRTVLFVSHNMGAVRSICDRCLLLGNGIVQAEGAAATVVDQYIAQYEEADLEDLCERIEGDRQAWLGRGEGFFLIPQDKCKYLSLLCGDAVTIEFDVEAPKPLRAATVGISIVGPADERVISMSSKVQNIPSAAGFSRFWRVRCEMGHLPLNAGTYFASVWIGNGMHDVARFSKAFTIGVREHDVFGWGNRLPSSQHWGPMYWAPKWDIRPA